MAQCIAALVPVHRTLSLLSGILCLSWAAAALRCRLVRPYVRAYVRVLMEAFSRPTCQGLF